MKVSMFFACVALTIGGVGDVLAQFTPVTAKIKITGHTPQSDGTIASKLLQKGVYYRSSSGDEITTHFPVDENGQKRGDGYTTFRDASSGKIYSIIHASRRVEVKQKVSAPMRPATARPPENLIVGEGVVSGLACVATDMTKPDGTSAGTSWRAISVDLGVKTEFVRGARRVVRELYDIQFVEPSRSHFRLPPGYTMNASGCRGCSD